MFCDVDRGASVLTAEGEALEHAQRDEDDGRQDPDLRVTGKEPDEHRGASHDADRQQEGDLPARLVADASEDDGAERPHRKAGAEGRQRAEQLGSGVSREEDRCKEGGEHGIEVEVVPLDDRADR